LSLDLVKNFKDVISQPFIPFILRLPFSA
jgi:hypothetical protein